MKYLPLLLLLSCAPLKREIKKSKTNGSYGDFSKIENATIYYRINPFTGKAHIYGVDSKGEVLLFPAVDSLAHYYKKKR
jgi:hypothetical protein